MAQTKAACERLLRLVRQNVRQNTGRDAGLQATTARLCNVFGSRGSVVPRFCRRLREGGPLPVTDPEMERRFISLEAAASAVLHTARQGGGTYVPRARRSVRVGELARRLVRWARPGADPEEWIEVSVPARERPAGSDSWKRWPPGRGRPRQSDRKDECLAQVNRGSLRGSILVAHLDVKRRLLALPAVGDQDVEGGRRIDL